MKLLRETIRRLIRENNGPEHQPESDSVHNEVNSIMDIYNSEDGWKQAFELANMLGPEISRHPSLQMWEIIDAATGDTVVSDVNYDQAMNPKYQAFVSLAEFGGYKENSSDDTPGQSPNQTKITDWHFEDAQEGIKEESYRRGENLKVQVKRVDEESFGVVIELVPE